MAKVLNPLHSSEARGRVGGVQWNTWRGTRYAKQQTAPAQPRSSRQLQIRAWCVQLVRMWQSLSAANQTQWTDYATAHPDVDWTNSPKRLTGSNWFVRCGIRLLDMSKAIVPTAPVTVAPDAPAAFAAADGILQSIVTWTPTAGTDLNLDLWHLGPVSKGIQAKIQRSKHKLYTEGEGGTVTCSGLAVGRHWFWARIVDEDNGLASSWVVDYADVTAA